MTIDRRGLFRAIVGTGAAFGLALGGCSADGGDSGDASAGTGGAASGTGGSQGSGGTANHDAGGTGGATDAAKDKVVTDTFRGWATGVPCAA